MSAETRTEHEREVVLEPARARIAELEGQLRDLRGWALQMANQAAEAGHREPNALRREWHSGAEHIANGLLTWLGERGVRS